MNLDALPLSMDRHVLAIEDILNQPADHGGARDAQQLVWELAEYVRKQLRPFCYAPAEVQTLLDELGVATVSDAILDVKNRNDQEAAYEIVEEDLERTLSMLDVGCVEEIPQNTWVRTGVLPKPSKRRSKNER